MADLERFVELYRSVGVEPLLVDDPDSGIGTQYLYLETGRPTILGYAGFSTSIYFDRDGKYLHQEIDE